jgi:hypothetical protein
LPRGNVGKAAAHSVGGEKELVLDKEQVGGQLGLLIHVITSYGPEKI